MQPFLQARFREEAGAEANRLAKANKNACRRVRGETVVDEFEWIFRRTRLLPAIRVDNWKSKPSEYRVTLSVGPENAANARKAGAGSAAARLIKEKSKLNNGGINEEATAHTLFDEMLPRRHEALVTPTNSGRQEDVGTPSPQSVFPAMPAGQAQQSNASIGDQPADKREYYLEIWRKYNDFEARAHTQQTPLQ